MHLTKGGFCYTKVLLFCVAISSRFRPLFQPFRDLVSTPHSGSERALRESCASLQHDLKADTKPAGLFKRVPHSTEMLAVPCQLW